ncbi:MAG: metallophosphoesterase [Candidatus Pacearchaeota archaeon]
MKQKRLFPQERIRFMNKSLLIDNEILVFGDLHIGLEENIAAEGLIPRIQLKETIHDLDEIFKILEKEKIKLKKIIVLGDLKHELGEISESEWRDVLKLLDYLIKKCSEIVLIKGNHDNIIGPIARKKQVRLENYYLYKDILFAHGNKEYKEFYDKEIKILVFGHLHPAISFSDEYKKEKYKCFLKGKWKNKEVYILPSFSELNIGYDLGFNRDIDNGRNGFLVIPKKELNKFNVLIYNNKEKKVYDFGKLKKLI